MSRGEREAWDEPWRDFARRFTRRGRAHLWVKGRIVGMVERLRRELAEMEMERQRALDRDDILARCDAWDAAESDRIRRQTLTDLHERYPDLTVDQLRAMLVEFRTLAKDLPWGDDLRRLPKDAPAPEGRTP
ncbi:MAG: hypothetical protein L3K23_10455 [Thermoplasmata archaeon]|nr:hypothetical protein [Thermoplasmata archaeon]